MADNLELQPNFSDKETSSEPSFELKDQEHSQAAHESAPQSVEDLDRKLTATQSPERVHTLEEISQLPESAPQLSDKGKIALLENMLVADVKDNFPKEKDLGTAAAELQDLANEAEST